MMIIIPAILVIPMDNQVVSIVMKSLYVMNVRISIFMMMEVVLNVKTIANNVRILKSCLKFAILVWLGLRLVLINLFVDPVRILYQIVWIVKYTTSISYVSDVIMDTTY